MEPTQTFMEIFDMVLKSLFPTMCPTAHSLVYLTLLYFKFIFLCNTLLNDNYFLKVLLINEVGIFIIVMII